MILNIAMIAAMIGSQPQYSAFLDHNARRTAARCANDESPNHFSINYCDGQDVYRLIQSNLPKHRRVKEFSCTVHDCSYDTHNVTCYFMF